jgi:phenylpropionate dioxygenase-like ring-hydroxylating dioxygenase large terminal subunit
VTYERQWLAAMRPFWHVVARSRDVTPASVVGVELLTCRFRLRRDDAGRVEADEVGAHEAADNHRLVEAYGFVWMCLERAGWERRSVPEIGLLDAGTHRASDGAPLECPVQNLRYVEHVCEGVSARVIADGAASIDSVGVDGSAWTLQFRVERADQRPARHVIDGYDVALPCSVLIEEADGGPAVFFHATPTGPATTRVFWSSLVPIVPGVERERDSLEGLLRLDLPGLEAREPKGLPLEAAGDLHLPQERFAVAYRHALAALGVPSVPGEAPADAGRPGHGEEITSRA